MQHILDDVESRITTDYCYTVSLSDVKFAASRLKAHKNDGDYGLNSNHVIHANNDLLVHIGCMLNAAVVHSCLRSTIVPIPKGRNVMDSGNYRGIALNSVYSKLLDNIILYRHGDKLNSSELQFGFKAKSSTNMCTMVLKETMSY